MASSTPEQPGNKRYDKQQEKYEEKDSGNTCRRSRNTAKA